MASTEMSYGKAVRDELRVPTRELRHAIPQVYAGYKELHDAALAPGALDAKTKELIALAIGVATRCDDCIAFHAKAAAHLGATREEIMETLGMAIYMGAGPSVMYAAEALEAVDQITKSRVKPVAQAANSA